MAPKKKDTKRMGPHEKDGARFCNHTSRLSLTFFFLLFLSAEDGLGDPSLRASTDHFLSVRVIAFPSTIMQQGSLCARCASTKGMQAALAPSPLRIPRIALVTG